MEHPLQVKDELAPKLEAFKYLWVLFMSEDRVTDGAVAAVMGRCKNQQGFNIKSDVWSQYGELSSF